MNVLQRIAPYVAQREALAEAVLFEALTHDVYCHRFQELACLHGNCRFVDVRRQDWSPDRGARHDLVLVSQTGREYRIELGAAGLRSNLT